MIAVGVLTLIQIATVVVLLRKRWKREQAAAGRNEWSFVSLRLRSHQFGCGWVPYLRGRQRHPLPSASCVSPFLPISARDFYRSRRRGQRADLRAVVFFPAVFLVAVLEVVRFLAGPLARFSASSS
ncbi:hypothetical protein SAMN04487766_105158 [Actinomyces ruminicola]|uniref:Uncharacterized protein n=1 Tax=Actinomyces ruminicola TaxID=332524 RepID=A0A1G9V9I5_9ACTO|nr:hypothetical protein SAMN04487766_105158 [Actinomyces ruminicola]